MTSSRRDFLKASALTGLAFSMPKMASTQSLSNADLHASQTSFQLAPDGYPSTSVWSFNSHSPGPELRVQQGARIQQRLINDLSQETSVHWHGIRIDNSMDGVAGLTQAPVKSGETFTYNFVTPDAGTYWYHAHNRSFEQVGRGLYGALIVDEPVAPDVDQDQVLILDDWRIDPETAQIIDTFTASHDRSHAGRKGNYITTNSLSNYSMEAKKGERLRLRLINAANGRIFTLSTVGLEGWIMAYDGMPLETPEKLEGNVFLAPGQRIDLFVDVVAEQGEDAYLVRVDDGQGFAQATVKITGTANANLRGTPVPLSPNRIMNVDGLDTATRVSLNMEGGAMGRLTSAILGSKTMNMGEIAAANQFWAFNGIVGMTLSPLVKLSRNEVVRMSIINNTSFPHAMHLHGMHFREILEDGSLGSMRDTLLSFSGQTREIAFVAHNPGKWLFHCHMLAHAASGMTTWLEVA